MKKTSRQIHQGAHPKIIVSFSSNFCQHSFQVNLKVFDHHNNSYISLECKNYVKYLGVLIDENLSRKYHMAHIASKISKTTGIIARLRHFVPLNTSHHIHTSLTQPYLLYGTVFFFKNMPSASCSSVTTILMQYLILSPLAFFF